MIEIEEFRDVPGYEGLYEVSNLGRVKNIKTGRILKPWKCTSGYLEVYLASNGKHEVKLIHRLVAQSFLSNPNNYPQVNHKDEDKTNNAVENLEWCTSQYNANYGSRNKKVSESRSIPILQLDLKGNFISEYESGVEAERITGIYRQNISNCCSGRYKTAGGFVWRYKN